MQCEITERKCDRCDKTEQHRKDDVGGRAFLGWFEVRTLTMDGFEKYDLCGTKCLEGFADEAAEGEESTS